MTMLQIVLSIAVPIVTLVLNTVINLVLRFSPDAKTAARRLRMITLRGLYWILNLWLAGTFIWQSTSSEPVTRISVAIMTMDAAALVVSFLLWMLLRLHAAGEKILVANKEMYQQQMVLMKSQTEMLVRLHDDVHGKGKV